MTSCVHCYLRHVVRSKVGWEVSPPVRFGHVVQRHLCFHQEHGGFATMECDHPDHVAERVLES